MAGDATARSSYGIAARRGLWEAVDTLHCGHPEVLRSFFAELPAGGRVLDVGCWNGSVAALAWDCLRARHGDETTPWSSYTGVDVVPEAVARFNERHRDLPETTAVEGDVRALPFPDASADAVLCLFVLQDMEGYRADGLRALRELVRVTRPGGRVLIGLTVHAEREEEIVYVVRKLRAHGVPEKPTHHWRQADFEAALVDVGLREPSFERFGPSDRGFVEVYASAIRGAPGA